MGIKRQTMLPKLNPTSAQIPRLLKYRNLRRLPTWTNSTEKKPEPNNQTCSNKLLLSLRGNSRTAKVWIIFRQITVICPSHMVPVLACLAEGKIALQPPTCLNVVNSGIGQVSEKPIRHLTPLGILGCRVNGIRRAACFQGFTFVSANISIFDIVHAKVDRTFRRA